jgi:hypothetical protein
MLKKSNDWRQKMNSNNLKVFTVLILSLCSFSYAHKPIFTEEKGISSETAVKINKPQVSQVIYRELTDDIQQLWLAVDAKKDFELFVQIGILVIDRQNYFRPAFVVLGPELPKVYVPFAIPEEIGGKIFNTGSVKPKFFHEHFTKTDSWILRGETIKLPSDGRYYVVAYSPCKLEGKFWLSVGSKENFTIFDWLSFGGWKKKIRKFHETDMEELKTKVIDDFSDPNRISNLGTKWSLVTDRVMGGVSDAEYLFGSDECFKYITMKGNVSLENNGGFVQVSLPLAEDSKTVDATAYSGVRFWVKGNGQQYYVHLKNDKTKLHWQYYSAEFVASDNWKQIEIPFGKFMPQALDAKIDVKSLSRISIVGAKKAYEVDVYIGPIEFYSKNKSK